MKKVFATTLALLLGLPLTVSAQIVDTPPIWEYSWSWNKAVAGELKPAVFRFSLEGALGPLDQLVDGDICTGGLRSVIRLPGASPDELHARAADWALRTFRSEFDEVTTAPGRVTISADLSRIACSLMSSGADDSVCTPADGPVSWGGTFIIESKQSRFRFTSGPLFIVRWPTTTTVYGEAETSGRSAASVGVNAPDPFTTARAELSFETTRRAGVMKSRSIPGTIEPARGDRWPCTFATYAVTYLHAAFITELLRYERDEEW